jgi:hypothetical protein
MQTSQNPPDTRVAVWLKCLLALAGCMSALLVAELGVRAVVKCRREVPPTADLSLENEWQWAAEHLAAGQAVYDTQLTHDPWLGWRNKPNLRDERFRTNSAGLRAAREFGETPPADRQRLLLLGDSFTFGCSVRNEETFAHLLEAKWMPQWEVLNMAVIGYGTDQQLIALEREGKQFRPHVVLLGFFVGDYFRNLLSFFYYSKPMFVPDGEGLKLTHSPVPSPEELYADYVSGRRRIGAGVWSYALGALRKSLAGDLRDRRITESSPGVLVLSRLMARFAAEVRAAGATPVWVIIPERKAMKKPSVFDPLEGFCERRAAELQMPCLTLTEALRQWTRAHPDEPAYLGRNEGGHFSPAGHRVVAEEIHRFLERAGIPQSPPAAGRGS